MQKFIRLVLWTLCGALVTVFRVPITNAGEPANHSTDLADVKKAIPTIVLDIRYATKNNFTHKVLYPRAVCALDKSVVERLKQVQSDLAAEGLRLKAYDCYRPVSVQKKLWALVPDTRYVADPAQGSRHNRGFAVDLTLIDRKGRELEMPTQFDDFSTRAHRDAPASPAAAKNRKKLEDAMARRGFVGLPTEWWHFDAPGWEKAPVLNIPLEHIK